MNSEMGETINAVMVKEWILGQGIDLVGIARADNLILSHPPRPATALMPTAKSVIVMAVVHTLGAVYAPDIMLWTRSKMQTSRLLDQTSEKLGRRLERAGFLTLPPASIKEWPGYIKMLRRHWQQLCKAHFPHGYLCNRSRHRRGSNAFRPCHGRGKPGTLYQR